MLGRIIIVCTGNICRSPMAEALLSQQLANGSAAAQVSSAGIAALRDHPADPLAQLVMEEQGFDISAHRARQASLDLLLGADLILVLDQTHQDWIRARHPALQGRVYKLGRWQNNIDISDPYGGPKSHFDHAYAEIKRCSDDWVRRIRAS